MFSLPPIPEGAAYPRSTGSCELRFEDVAQDGRIDLTAIPQCLDTLWGDIFRSPEIVEPLRRDGILPILSRLVVVGSEESFPTAVKLNTTGTWDMSHSVDGRGEINRLFLNMYAQVKGKRGRTYGFDAPGRGELVVAGRVFAEHVFTRPFGSAENRRVLRLPLEGREVPPMSYTQIPLESLAELPEGAAPLEDGLRPDGVVLVLGPMHTDSNQHVNSLAYPRIFEEAVLRRLMELGRSPLVLARGFDIAWRKPFFMGDPLRIMLQLAEYQGDILAVGAFVAEGQWEKPRSYIRMLLK